MIAFANPQRRKKLVVPAWHANFLAIEPQIREQAEVAFRRAGSELKSELVSEVVANALVAYARLVKLGRKTLPIRRHWHSLRFAKFAPVGELEPNSIVKIFRHPLSNAGTASRSNDSISATRQVARGANV